METDWSKLKLCPTLVGICFAESEEDVNVIISQSGTKLYCLQVYKNNEGTGKATYFLDYDQLENFEPISREEFDYFYRKVQLEFDWAEREVNL